MRQRIGRRGFTLIELLVVIAIIALLIGILLPALGEAKRLARRTLSESNQKNLVIGGVNYSTDFKGRIPSFTWRTWDANSQWDDLQGGNDPVMAAAFQAVDIIRRRADLTPEEAPRLTGWIPHVLYTHLVLNDFLAQRLPEKMVANPEDKFRLCWQRFPRRVNGNLEWQQNCTGPTDGPNIAYRWAYSSSYQFVPASYDPGQLRGGANTIQQSQDSHRFYDTAGAGALGNLTYAQVTFPQQKVMLHDSHARHSGPEQLYYAYREAVQPVGFFDGSVRQVKTSDSNEGFFPRRPNLDRPLNYYYEPDTWEPATKSGASREIVAGWYRWTRGGLSGIDIGADEVRTGNPGADDNQDGLP